MGDCGHDHSLENDGFELNEIEKIITIEVHLPTGNTILPAETRERFNESMEKAHDMLEKEKPHWAQVYLIENSVAQKRQLVVNYQKTLMFGVIDGKLALLAPMDF